MEIEQEEGNVYAYNIQDIIIHISQAKSGRKGYYCLGCKRELQACKAKIEFRASYFRHDPKFVPPGGKCKYSDETHRHKLAKDILQLTHKIKVPPLYKYPPKSEPGLLANLIRQDEFIIAHRVENETCFFEDDAGEIQWGKKDSIGNRNLLIQPDVTFFDEFNKPILFVELVATHGLTVEKLVKIKRLGIDTIQVIIPKGSPEEIERTLLISDKTKWVYNNEQERTEYIPTSNPDSEGIPSFDELQRKFFEETYQCRAAQINNLIRSIRKCIESKPYRDIEGEFRSEISRVERNTRDHTERLHRIQESHRDEIINRYSEKRGEIKKKRTENRATKAGLREDFNRKSEAIRGEEAELDREAELLELRITETITSLGGIRLSSEDRKKEIGREESAIELNITRGRGRIEQLKSDRINLPGKYESLEESVRSKFRVSQEDEERSITGIREDKYQLPIRFEEDRAELEVKFDDLRTDYNRRIKNRDTSGTDELSRRIKNLLEARGLLINYEKEVAAFKRNNEAWRSFKSGAYKGWID